MARRPTMKSNQRFVMYIPWELRTEVEDWVNRRGVSLAEFGREALETYLRSKQKEERNQQLVETCKLFETRSRMIFREWARTETESWSA